MNLESDLKRFEGKVMDGPFHVPYCDKCGKPWLECQRERESWLKIALEGERGIMVLPHHMEQAGICPGGNMTIGYGHHIGASGIRQSSADNEFDLDLPEAVEYADEILGIYPKPATSSTAFRVLVHLVFWIGAGKVQRGFPKFVQALRDERYADAALELIYRNSKELVHSKLYEQAPARVDYLVGILRAEQIKKDGA